MLEINQLREKKDEYINRLARRGRDFTPLVEQALDTDAKRRANQTQLDSLLAEANQLAKQIGQLYKQGNKSEADSLKAKTATLKEQTQTLREKQQQLEQSLNEVLYQIPNAPHTSVKMGKDESANEEVERFGQKTSISTEALPHWDLAAKYDLIDFELGVKITGAGFPLYKGKGAKLQRALISWFLSEAEKAGYQEIIPPLLVNPESGRGTGQLPDKEGQMYHVTEDDLYLIPTSEVPLANIYRDVIVEESDFPVKLCGYTPCFRREAGSYGKDVRGLNRLHQFDKVEIVQIVKPENSYQALDAMVAHVKKLIETLGLEARILRLCGGDTGFSSALTYDFEVFSPAQQKWLEVSSVSNCEAFQANRMKCRYKTDDKKTQLVHTLNGSALALPRILAAILETYQFEGGIKVPECLLPYTAFDTIT